MKKQESMERLAEIKRLYLDEKWSLKQIGNHFGVSAQSIFDRLRRAGILLRPAGATEKRLSREAITDLHINKNLTLGETARRLNVDSKVLAREMKRLRIEKRPHGGKKRKYDRLCDLKAGETVVIPRPETI